MSNVMNSAGHPNRLRHVLQFQLEKWPQGRKIQVSTLNCLQSNQIFEGEKRKKLSKMNTAPVFKRSFHIKTSNDLDAAVSISKKVKRYDKNSSRQILDNLQASSAPTAATQVVRVFWSFWLFEALQEQPTMTPRPGQVKINQANVDNLQLLCFLQFSTVQLFRVWPWFLTGTHTKCPQQLWRRTSKV